MYAEVIIDISHREINRSFDYIIPDIYQGLVKKGARVIVPFTDNNIERLGVVVNVKEKSLYADKALTELLDFEPILDDESFLITQYLLKNPSTLISKAYEMVLPKDLLVDYVKEVTIINKDEIPEGLEDKFNKNGKWVLKKQDYNHIRRIKVLEEKGILRLKTILKPKYEAKLIPYIKLIDYNYIGRVSQNELLKYLKDHHLVERSELHKLFSYSMVKTLLNNKVVELVYEESQLSIDSYDTNEQLLKRDSKINNLLKNISLNKFNNYLTLGKGINTKVLNYNLIKEVIDNNEQVLVLVPERFMINDVFNDLTTYFPNELITTVASFKTKKERYMNYEAILNNSSKITIGARSSIFTQFNDLGLILVLDSYDSEYTNTESIYYNALDLALIRAKYHNIPLIYESYLKTVNFEYLIKSNRLTLIDLTKDETKPRFSLVDMKEELLTGNTSMLSVKLKEALDKVLDRNQTALLLMNRKGYASFVMCRSCGYVPKDEITGLPLNYSQKDKKLYSNLTKYEEAFTEVCPNCGNRTLKPVGSGIEQLESYLKMIYPNTNILVVDSNNINNKELHKKISNLELEPYNIIIGTKMALKTALEKRVSLVGILLFDQFLKLPNYDASEDAYQILKLGELIAKDELIVQSYDTKSYVLEGLIDSDIFFDNELKSRALTKMPPYNNLLHIMVGDESYLKAYQRALTLKETLIKEGYSLLGPRASLLLKIDNLYQFLLVLKYQTLNDFAYNLLKTMDNVKTFPALIWK